jgi:multicomponent Na+:H+ antiporter subunit E
MRMFTLNLLLALVWVFVTEWFTFGNLLLGFIAGGGLLILTHPTPEAAHYGRRLVKSVTFSIFYIREVIEANLRLAYYTVMPLRRMRAAIIAVPLEPMSEMERFFLSNLITLTPGTLTVDISEDGSIMYIHTVWFVDEESFRQEIKQKFERKFLEVVR